MTSVAALLLHAALLGEASWTWPEAQAAPRAAAMQVRTIEPAGREVTREAADQVTVPQVLTTTVSTQPMQSAPGATKARAVEPKPAARAVPAAQAGSKKATAPLDAAEAQDVAPTVGAQLDRTQSESAQVDGMQLDGMQMAAAIAPKPRVEPAPPPASSPAGEDAIPHYRTKMPRAATLRYQVSKGMLHGTGELQWRPQNDRYELTLESKLAGMTLLTQVSSGVFDSEGIAPLRFTDTRLRRSTIAANFQRDQGKISFSGAHEEFPLWPGAQDRVSWMVQLAAIVAAQPELRVPGAKVAMHVVGANADASVWAFQCVGNESVRTDLGPVNAIKYVREPRGPHDTTAQAWLDPTHHFLPARATLRSGPDDEGYELRLQDVTGSP